METRPRHVPLPARLPPLTEAALDAQIRQILSQSCTIFGRPYGTLVGDFSFSRIIVAHIGTFRTAQELSSILNRWLEGYVLPREGATEEETAERPLGTDLDPTPPAPPRTPPG